MAQEKLKQVTSTRTVTTLREEEAGKVKVVYGVHMLEASLAGRSVQSVREALAQPLNISPQAVTLVDGQEVESTRILSPGELLEFVRYAGEKGLLEDLTPLNRPWTLLARGGSVGVPVPQIRIRTVYAGLAAGKVGVRASPLNPSLRMGAPMLNKAIRLVEECLQRNRNSRRVSHSGRRDRAVVIERIKAYTWPSPACRPCPFPPAG